MTPTLDFDELEKLPDSLPRLTLQKAVRLLDYLVREPTFRNSQDLPLSTGAEWKREWYVAYRCDAPDYSLQIFVWPPGSRTKVHDHSCWGAFCCVVGSILEERYRRLNDGSRQDHARLHRAWRQVWRRDDGVSIVLPYDGGIHRIVNPGWQTAISVHLYGPRIGEVDGRDYDPTRDYVCDRRGV